MTYRPDPDSLHRTAKYFMDSGRVARPEEAVELLESFGLTISVGSEVAASRLHQIALLTLINVARRTFLAGVEVVGIPDCGTLVPLAGSERLADAVREFGGVPVSDSQTEWPCAIIGSAKALSTKAAWQVTWQSWRGGVIPAARATRLDEAHAIPLAPALAAAMCAAEVFAFHTGDHPMAGKREFGISLWDLATDWLIPDEGPELGFLPSRLWIIGLGNLGQAFAWLLALLPYGDRSEVELVLQDFDRIAKSNDSTSVLSFLKDIGKRKARVVGDWLDRVGFNTYLDERRFGSWSRRSGHEPSVALCGVDNAEARMALEDAGFGLIVEVGLGGGTEAFRSLALHTFPATQKAREMWSRPTHDVSTQYKDLPAYQVLKKDGMDECGLVQLAARSVGVPFVGLIAACLAISELLRRLNGGSALEFAAGSAMTLDFEIGRIDVPVYSHGHVEAKAG